MGEPAMSRTSEQSPGLHSDHAGPQQTVRVDTLVHCLIERKGDLWLGYTLEFGLAAQAATETAVRCKLNEMIGSYLFDALCGEDRQHASELLNRRATLGVRIKYWLVRCLAPLFTRRSQQARTYDSGVPLGPLQHC